MVLLVKLNTEIAEITNGSDITYNSGKKKLLATVLEPCTDPGMLGSLCEAMVLMLLDKLEHILALLQ